MTDARHFSAATYNTLKTAWKRLVLDLGTIDSAAACTRVGRSQIAEYGAPNGPKFAPADVVLDLEAQAGTPYVTAALAQAQGYTLVMTEPRRTRSELAALLARIGRDSGDLFATAAVALGHNRLEEKERAALLRELDQMRRDVDEAAQFLRQDSVP